MAESNYALSISANQQYSKQANDIIMISKSDKNQFQSYNNIIYQNQLKNSVLNATTYSAAYSFMSFLKLLKSKKKPVTILKGITGVIKPGRMTLLLGPPGAGQTTLLLALAGKLDKSLEVSGKVTYNGHSMREFVPQRTSVYISQKDLHIGEMTVRETMDFSARCQGSIKPDPDIDFFMKAIALEGQKSSILTDYILKLLGLEVCSETMVGDDMRRGISGGQKKRVTTGEMMVGPSTALLMDEISTGLDSSTTFQIVNCLRQFVHVFSGSLVASLLQPAPETYDLFDDIILLCEGQVVYHGPRESILNFFHMMGFRCKTSLSYCKSFNCLSFSLNPFFRQFFLLFNLHQMSLSLFLFIGALGRNQIISNTFGAFALLVIFVLGGFIVSREDIYSWWKWGYWSSPLMYAQNAVAVNEFLSNRWIQNGVHIGQLLLKIRGIFTDANWYWIGIGALMGYNVVFNILYTLALKYLDPLGKPQASITEDTSEGKHEDQIKVNGHLNGKVFGKSHSLSCVSLLVGDSTTTNGMKEKKGMVLPFKPLALAFKEIKYFVDMPAEMKAHGEEQDRLQLLQGVSGSFRPGVLTCLMGVRGAGKTSLMDVLAEHKTGGYIEGSISISGYSKKQETFARISGYCEQNDIHSPNLTVHESLLFSAWLRLPADAFVEEVMELVELNNLREALVGVPGVNGLSTEQRKRLTIGPTSGLDARAAAIVLRTVRYAVDTGRTVVCTIHQPSIDICESFDELFLMKRGGQVIYAGPLGTNSQQLTGYFQSIEGVPEITSGYNPATWMLEVTSIASENGLQADFANIYANSPLYERNMALIEELSKPTPGSQDLHFETQFSQPFMVQAVACLWKQHWSYWRNPQYNAVRFFFTLVAALLFGSIFWDMGSKIEQQQDFLNAMGSMFSAVLFLGVNNASSVQPVVDIERSVFYRERAAGMFSALPYALAQVLVELPYVFVQTAVYGVVFLWLFFFMFFTFLYYTYYGMMTVALTPNSIPGWWRWYYWGCPVTWTLYGLMVSQFGNVTKQLLTAEGNPVSLRDFLNASYGFDYDMLPWVACVVVGYAILFALVFALSIRTLNFQAR
ncbi:hypothetical protein AMTRI_Chr12g268230 [Amborella trichopoda]